MAASTVAGGIFNAFAFAGASWIFSHVDHQGYQVEQKRHDLAEERMQAAHDLWQKREIELKDKMEKQKLETERADHDLQEGVDALDQYHKLLKEYSTLQKYGERIKNIDDFYHPSEKFQSYISLVKVRMIGGIIYVGSKLL